MVSSELIFLLSALAEVTIVFFAARLGREWLLGTIAINLILVGIFGAKLVSVFGLVTNVGNVFYACVFLATYFLIERQGKNSAWQTIWFGISSIAFFTLISQLTVYYTGLSISDEINSASTTLFSFSLRIILASIIAYVCAQYVNIKIYSLIGKKTNEKFLWLRVNGANIISQLVDSMLFFSIAFIDLSGPLLLQAILTGWFLKSLVIFGGTPFIYLDLYLDRKKYDTTLLV